MYDKLAPYLVKITGRRSGDFEVCKLTGDASTREYFRVKTPSDPEIRSLIVMSFAPEKALVSDEGESTRATEFPFLNVRDFLAAGGLPVPKVYLSDIGRGLVFLEDLGDVLLHSALADANDEVRSGWYRRALDLLVRFQARCLEAPAPEREKCVAYGRRFDFDLLLWEFEHYLEWGIEALYDLKMPASERAVCRAAFTSVCRDLLAAPQIVVHRDWQSRNLMISDDDLRIIDFQDALMGPWPYDVVALLYDSYVVLTPALRDRLVEHYLDSYAAAIDPAADRALFRRLFRLQSLQRKMKDAGRFVFIDRVRKNPNFLQYIPATLGYVRELLHVVDGMGETAAILASYEKRLAP